MELDNDLVDTDLQAQLDFDKTIKMQDNKNDSWGQDVN
jgi:hypothetical protein